MKNTGKCPKCGGTDIAADAKVLDRGEYNVTGEMSVATFRKPDALIFKQEQQTTVSAWVCCTCGFVELYADHPARIQLPKR
jgi:predicted nucleic-acid-binding Zn-ribbon protein